MSITVGTSTMTDTNTRATHTPWKLHYYEDDLEYAIRNSRDCDLVIGSNKATLMSIVHCVNLHEELVGALKTIYVWEKRDNESPANTVKSFKNIIDKAEETLKKAGVL